MTDSDGADARERVADIYEQYAPHVAAYALRRATGTDAADVVAETFLVAWRRRDVVPEEPDTLPWLYGVARRVLANQRRGNRRSGQLRERLAFQFVRHDVGQPPVEDVEEFQRIGKALRSLSDDDAEVLRLTACEALTPSEIATTMGIAPGTARQRISRARQRLRKHLDTHGLDTHGLDTDGLEIDGPEVDGFGVGGLDVDMPGRPPTEADRTPDRSRSRTDRGDPNSTYLYSSVRRGVTR